MPTAYVNGTFLPLEQAQVSVLDRGLLFADAVYEVIPVYAGAPFLLDAHLRRLANSLAGIRLRNPHDDPAWRRLIGELIDANGGGDLAVYLQVTRGADARRDHRIPEPARPTVIAFCQSRSAPPPETLRDGVAAITCPDTRWAACAVKSTSLLANILLADDAYAAGAAEAILVRDGQVMEGASSNVFAVLDGLLATPALRPEILPGITRAHVLDVARANGIDCAEAMLTPEGLASADEIWLTSSTREIYPVTRLDGAVVGNGKPGALWTTMHRLLHSGNL